MTANIYKTFISKYNKIYNFNFSSNSLTFLKFSKSLTSSTSPAIITQDLALKASHLIVEVDISDVT